MNFLRIFEIDFWLMTFSKLRRGGIESDCAELLIVHSSSTVGNSFSLETFGRSRLTSRL